MSWNYYALLSVYVKLCIWYEINSTLCYKDLYTPGHIIQVKGRIKAILQEKIAYSS